MRKWKLAAAATAASGALAIGMFAAFTLTAKAGTESEPGCTAVYTGTVAETEALTCTATDTAADGKAIPYPLSITISATTSTTASPDADAGLPVSFSWSSVCTEPSGVQEKAQGSSATSNDSFTLTPNSDLNVIDPTTCDLTVTATVTGDDALDATALDVTVTDDESAAGNPTASASPTPSTSTSSASATKHYNNQVHGFDGTCLDDKGNSSSKRAEVVLWQCNNTNPAQGWSYSGDKLKIHGLCVNAKGNGKQNSKLILWPCGGSANEIWVHNSKDEYVEKANGWKLCMDDPAYATKNGTRLIVYKCKNTANQHFSKP